MELQQAAIRAQVPFRCLGYYFNLTTTYRTCLNSLLELHVHPSQYHGSSIPLSGAKTFSCMNICSRRGLVDSILAY